MGHRNSRTGNNCGTARTSTITFTQQNGLNTTGNEPVDSTCYIYKVTRDGHGILRRHADGHDCRHPAAGDCNQLYRMYCVSTDSNGGDSGHISSVSGDGLKVISKTDDKSRTIDGAGIELLTNAPTYSVTWKGKQHATLQSRAKDVLADAANDDEGDRWIFARE